MTHAENQLTDLHEDLIDPIDAAVLQQEITSLPASVLIESRGDFDVFLCPAELIPNVLREIGRLREFTFRSVGEGTGNALDVDEFDQYYLNLFIWDRSKHQIAGGYRMGPGADI